MTKELNDKEKQIVDATIMQARKINALAIEITTNPNHPGKNSVLYSKWESASETNNQTTTVYTTERATVSGDSIPILGLLAERSRPHPGLLTHSIPNGSDTTLYRHYSKEELAKIISNVEESKNVANTFPDGVFLPINPSTLACDHTKITDAEQITNMCFEKQLFLTIITHVKRWDFDRNFDFIMRDIKESDTHSHPDDAYTELFNIKD